MLPIWLYLHKSTNQHNIQGRIYAANIITNEKRGTLYIGVTSNLVQLVWQHMQGTIVGFTQRYDTKRLVYYELHVRNSERKVSKEIAAPMEVRSDF